MYCNIVHNKKKKRKKKIFSLTIAKHFEVLLFLSYQDEEYLKDKVVSYHLF